MVSQETIDKETENSSENNGKEMLGLKLPNKTPCLEISRGTMITDSIEYTLKQKWKRAVHDSKNEGQQVNQTLHRVATKEKGRDEEDDQAEDGKTT